VISKLTYNKYIVLLLIIFLSSCKSERSSNFNEKIIFDTIIFDNCYRDLIKNSSISYSWSKTDFDVFIRHDLADILIFYCKTTIKHSKRNLEFLMLKQKNNKDYYFEVVEFTIEDCLGILFDKNEIVIQNPATGEPLCIKNAKYL